MNGERPLQNHGSSNCSNQLRINDEFAQLGGVYYTPPLDSPRSPIAVYPLSSTDDAPCRSLGLSSLLALNRKSILRLRQTATISFCQNWPTVFARRFREYKCFGVVRLRATHNSYAVGPSCCVCVAP